MISHKKDYLISGIVGFFGTIAAIVMDIPTVTSIATGTISPFKNSIVIELALLYILLMVVLFFKKSRTKKSDVAMHEAHAQHEHLSLFTRSLLSFMAGSAIGIFVCFIYLIIGFRMISPNL
jgi:hypothetical protein